MNWRDRAGCVGLDIDLFFVERGQNIDPMVRKLCRQCPVSADCLEFALSLPENPQGFWAGTTERQRDRLRRLSSTPQG